MGLRKDFLWGGAVTAYQLEGDYDLGGKGLNIMDVMTSGNQKTPRGMADGVVEGEHYPNHEGIDFYHHLRGDIKLLAEMSSRCFRASIAWTWIFPNGDEEEPNEEGLRFYDGMFDECLRCEMEPVVTPSHLEMPLHPMDAYDVWRSRKLIDFSVRSAAVCSERYRGKVKYWTTFNEINNQTNHRSLFGLYADSGILCGDREDAGVFICQTARYELTASARAVKLGYEINPGFQIGYMIATCPVYPVSCWPGDMLMAERAIQKRYYYTDVHAKGKYPPDILKYWERKGMTPDVTGEDMADLKQGTADYIGFSYYTSFCIRHREGNAWSNYDEARGLVVNPYVKVSDWGWQIDSMGLRYAANWFADRYDVSLFTVKNGLGAYDKVEEDGSTQDDYRVEYLKIRIEQMKRAVGEDGASLLGYTSRGCTDLISTGTGRLDKRYGLICVDKHNDSSGGMHRSRKKSFGQFKKVIVSNGEVL